MSCWPLPEKSQSYNIVLFGLCFKPTSMKSDRVMAYVGMFMPSLVRASGPCSDGSRRR